MRKLMPAWIVVAAAFGLSLWAKGRMPGRVPTHWNIQGQPDAWGPPGMNLWLTPLMLAVLLLLFWAIPKIDPRRASWAQHESTYWTIVNGIAVFMLAMHVAIVGAGLGWTTHTGRWIPVLAGLLFAFLGNLMTRIRPNFFVGIRTPWTLTSDENWRKTHRMGGPLLMLGGLALVVGGLLGGAWFGVSFAILLVLSLAPIVYSYRLWKREQRSAAV